MKKIKLIIVGIIGLIGLGSFSNAGEYKLSIPVLPNNASQTFTTSDWFIFPIAENVSGNHVIDFCFYGFNNYDKFQVALQRWDGSSYATWKGPDNITSNNYCGSWNLSTTNNYGRIALSLRPRNQFYVGSTTDIFDYYSYVILSGDLFQGGSCPECETCDDPYTSLECQQQYSLMPINSCNTEYCEMNNLCATTTGSDCPYSTGESQLFINDIRHESTPFINLYIPEEIQRNYNYTGNGTQLDIDVEGYGYDQEKMQNMVNTQHYKPTSEEMSQLIEKVADFLPLIAVALLIIWIGRVLKKVFRF